MGKYQVRFATLKHVHTDLSGGRASAESPAEQLPHSRSRQGCKECRRSRVKCDETFPICGRCERRGIVCHAAPRQPQWQMHILSLATSGNTDWAKSSREQTYLMSSIGTANENSLPYWFNCVSRIMVTSEDTNNPFSYPIVQYFDSRPSLLHALRSISSAHQSFFNFRNIGASLEERNNAMRSFRHELSLGKPLHPSFLTAYMLGISSSYLDCDAIDFGKEHLFAGHKIVDMVLADQVLREHSQTHLIIGTFIYWDMTCSFLVEPAEQKPINTTFMYSYITTCMSTNSHPITGPCTSLFYLLCGLGRYLRKILDGAAHDLTLEIRFEQELLNWRLESGDELWLLTGDAFCRHGLILLYRLCGRSSRLPLSLIPSDLNDNIEGVSPSITTDTIVRKHVLELLLGLFKVPVTSPHLTVQSLPLLTAGGELAKDDRNLRRNVQSRFQALYSATRIPGNMSVARLLHIVWENQDRGDAGTWLELMLRNQWRLRLG